MKTMQQMSSALLILLFMFIFTTPSFALLGNAAGKAAQETIEYTARKFGIEISKDAGREFAEKAGQFIAKHGDDGARLLRHAGPDAMEQVAKHGDDLLRMSTAHSDDALSYLMKNADEMLPIWRSMGREGTEIALKHPGLAEPLIKEFGREALPMAQKLSSESLEKFLVLSSKATTQQEKKVLFGKVLMRGDDVINFLWSHKWKIGAGLGVYALLKDFDAAGSGKPGDSSGNNIVQAMVLKAWDTILREYPWVILVGICFLVLWIFPLLSWLWKLPRYSRKNPTPSTNSYRKSPTTDTSS